MATGDVPVKAFGGARFVSAFDALESLRLVPSRDWPALHWRAKGSRAKPTLFADWDHAAWVQLLSGRGAGEQLLAHRSWDSESRIAMYARGYPGERTQSVQIAIFIADDDYRAALAMKEPKALNTQSGASFVDAERMARKLVASGVGLDDFPELYLRLTKEGGEPRAATPDESRHVLRELSVGAFGGELMSNNQWGSRAHELGFRPLLFSSTGYVPVDAFFLKADYDAWKHNTRPLDAKDTIRAYMARHPKASVAEVHAALRSNPEVAGLGAKRLANLVTEMRPAAAKRNTGSRGTKRST